MYKFYAYFVQNPYFLYLLSIMYMFIYVCIKTLLIGCKKNWLNVG